MRKTRQQKHDDRRERRARELREAQARAPEGKIAVRSHGEIAYISARQEGEAVGRSGFTDRQIQEIDHHGTEVIARREAEERARTPKNMGEFLFGRRK